MLAGFHYDEYNEEVLKEKWVQTEEVASTEIRTYSEEYIIYSHQSNKMKNRCEFANNENKVTLNTGLSSSSSIL